MLPRATSIEHGTRVNYPWERAMGSKPGVCERRNRSHAGKRVSRSQVGNERAGPDAQSRDPEDERACGPGGGGMQMSRSGVQLRDMLCCRPWTCFAATQNKNPWRMARQPYIGVHARDSPNARDSPHPLFPPPLGKEAEYRLLQALQRGAFLLSTPSFAVEHPRCGAPFVHPTEDCGGALSHQKHAHCGQVGGDEFLLLKF